MKNCSLIKYTPGYSNHALSLHGYLFLDEAIKKLEREGLFLDVDYSYTIKYLNREIMTLFLTYSPRHESTIKSILDIKLSPTDEVIQRKIEKLEIETRKEFAYDLRQVKSSLQAIQNHEWSTFEDFSFYKETRLSTPKELLFNEIGEATLYTKFIAMRLKGSYLEENSHAPLLYTLLAGPIAMQIVHILQREYSSSIRRLRFGDVI